MLKSLFLLESKISTIEKYTIGVLLLIMSAIAFIQVLTRYCFFYSIVWSEEATRYCMIWLTFIGAAYAVSKQDHINIDLLTNFVLNKFHFDLKNLLNILICLISLACVYYTWILVISTYQSDQHTPAMRIPMYWIYLVIEISMILMAFHSLIRLLKHFVDNK